MGIGDMIDQAKQAAGGDAAVDSAVQQAVDVAKDKAPDQVDPLLDEAGEAAKKLL